MENHKQVKIYLKKEAIEQIQDVIEFKKVKDLLDKRESEYKSVEEFVVGCVYYYLKQIDSVEDISNIRYLITEHQLKNRFEELMIKKGWNQKELVERTGISAGNINNILKNKNQASIDNFFRIWIAFNCPPISNVLYRSDEWDSDIKKNFSNSIIGQFSRWIPIEYNTLSKAERMRFMLIATLIGIQTTCVAIATGYIVNRIRPRGVKLKLVSKENKHYKTI